MTAVMVAIAALFVGSVAGAWWVDRREAQRTASTLESMRLERDKATQESTVLRAQLGVAEGRAERDVQALADTKADLDGLRGKMEEVARERESLHRELAVLRRETDVQHQLLTEQVATLTQAREAMRTEFEALSAKVFEDRAKAMNEQGAAGLEQVLKPVREKLGEFQSKVETLQQQQVKDAAALGERLTQLGEVSRGMTEEASRLTRALTKQSQVRGAWGEQILQRVLEVAGLREGTDFVLQEAHRREDGSMPRPDVVVNLPRGRRVVVDAKLSLVDYVAYTAAVDEGDRSNALKQHCAAVRRHVRELSEKRYQDLVGTDTLDFVIAFVPIEQAYLAAVEADNALYDDAWARHVMFACPSTLLYALRMVSYLWTQEAQMRNIQEIVKRGAELYDKFVNFTEDLKAVGAALEKADSAYKDALSKLSSGKGNVVRQVEMLRELGVKPRKQIAPQMLDNTSLDATE